MKNVKEILEEFRSKIIGIDNAGYKSIVELRKAEEQELTHALAQIKQAYENCVPKEIEIPIDVCGVKVTIAEAYGHNACRTLTLERINKL